MAELTPWSVKESSGMEHRILRPRPLRAAASSDDESGVSDIPRPVQVRPLGGKKRAALLSSESRHPLLRDFR